MEVQQSISSVLSTLVAASPFFIMCAPVKQRELEGKFYFIVAQSAPIPMIVTGVGVKCDSEC